MDKILWGLTAATDPFLLIALAAKARQFDLSIALISTDDTIGFVQAQPGSPHQLDLLTGVFKTTHPIDQEAKIIADSVGSAAGALMNQLGTKVNGTPLKPIYNHDKGYIIHLFMVSPEEKERLNKASAKKKLPLTWRPLSELGEIEKSLSEKARSLVYDHEYVENKVYGEDVNPADYEYVEQETPIDSIQKILGKLAKDNHAKLSPREANAVKMHILEGNGKVSIGHHFLERMNHAGISMNLANDILAKGNVSHVEASKGQMRYILFWNSDLSSPIPNQENARYKITFNFDSPDQVHLITVVPLSGSSSDPIELRDEERAKWREHHQATGYFGQPEYTPINNQSVKKVLNWYENWHKSEPDVYRAIAGVLNEDQDYYTPRPEPMPQTQVQPEVAPVEPMMVEQPEEDPEEEDPGVEASRVYRLVVRALRYQRSKLVP